MSTDQREQSSTAPTAPDLPEAVAEALCELAWRESLELSVMYCFGERTLPDGAPLISSSVDTAFGSVGFVEDGRGALWVIW